MVMVIFPAQVAPKASVLNAGVPTISSGTVKLQLFSLLPTVKQKDEGLESPHVHAG